ncbi:hypothetical protein M114_0819 [Bacteroides fragilis str. 3986 N(B)22]|nr:hypothetical protein M114_0819 [Bacteroides fragilis str. 3986 N(B)22]EYA62985.1 hypothetical protein M070_0684 [Bacteroides fragilis str. A7 (UDC12-2)]
MEKCKLGQYTLKGLKTGLSVFLFHSFRGTLCSIREAKVQKTWE